MATKAKPFRTLLDPQDRKYSASGEMEEEVIAMKINDNGESEFYVAGKTNVYEKIQSYHEDTKIENILRRVSETGDISILNQVKAQYLDISELPGNIFEAQQKIKEAEKTFEQLPLELREKYNFNFNEYLKDFGSDNWLINMKLKEQPVEEIKEKGEDEE